MNKNSKRKLQKLKHQRYVNRKIQKWLRKRNNSQSVECLSHIGVGAYKKFEYTSDVFECLKRADFLVPTNFESSVVPLTIPEVFCLSKNPDESLGFLRTLYSALLNPDVTEIHFNHFNCRYMGVCASTIMDIIILECVRFIRSKGRTIRISGSVKDGRISDSDEVDTLVKMSGLLNHLDIYRGKIQNVEKLDLLVKGESSEVAEKSIEYINRSLARHGYMLTKEGANHFGKLFGEIVDNCKLHGGTSSVWYTLGHYVFDKDSNLCKCNLCIFDFGDTIYESLKNCDQPKILNRITHYVKKSLISFKSVRDKETLYTLFSLQQRVSRIIDKNVVRGNGTVTFIEAILKLFNTNDRNFKSCFSITSGKCSILFDGKYQLAEKSYASGYSNKIIAFNPENDLTKEPDTDYVRTLKNSFPGTAISMELYIDSKYLKGVD